MSRQSISTSSIWGHLSWIGWMTAAILFMIDPAMSAISYVAGVSLLFSAFLSFKSPLLGLYLLPLPMMIGPVSVLPITGVGFITAGDLYAAILIFRTLFLRGSRLKYSGQLILLFGAFLLVLSATLSPNLGASAVGLVKILQYALLVRASIILIKQPSDLRNLFTAWEFITTLCAIMMLWHFYNGRPYMIDRTHDDSGAYVSIDIERSDVLFRPTFFYANIYVPIGLSLFYSLMSILMKIEPSGFKRAILWITIPVNFLALLMNNCRAMLLPITVSSSLIVVWFCWKSLTRMKLNLRKLVFLILITGASIWFFGGFLITAPQRVALLERFNSVESVTMRLSVWTSALSKIFNNPLRVLVGWGPQSTARQIGESHIQDLFAGSLGNVEGAVDSTIIGFLVEYGVIFSTFVFVYIALWFSRTWNYYRLTGDEFALVFLVMSIILIFVHIFQQFGLNPPGLMILQLFAFLPMSKRTPQREL